MGKIVAWVLVLAVVVGLVIVGKTYYDDRYVGSDYWTVVPAGYDITPKTQYSDLGEDVGTGVTYKLTAYNEKGESRVLDWTIMSPDSGVAVSGEPYQPGTYLKVSASKQIVVGHKAISKGDVPAKVLQLIEK